MPVGKPSGARSSVQSDRRVLSHLREPVKLGQRRKENNKHVYINYEAKRRLPHAHFELAESRTHKGERAGVTVICVSQGCVFPRTHIPRDACFPSVIYVSLCDRVFSLHECRRIIT